MGRSSYTNDAADRLRVKSTARVGKSAKSYMSAPVGRSIKVDEVPKEVNPLGVKIRESRDSDAHPNSKGIVVCFDTTASMQHFPHIFASEALPKLMGLLVQKDFCEDPQVLFSAFNDATTGAHGLQVGQFESSDEVDDDLTRLPLQGGGGGSMEESSELAIYWAARHTEMDCFQKRGQKGYLFILTDEKPYPVVRASHVKDIIGDGLEADIKTEDIVAEAKERFEVFCVMANTGSYRGRTDEIQKRWIDLLGEEHVLFLQDAAGVAELIAATVGLFEGRFGDDMASDLADAGVDASTAGNVSTALAKLSDKRGAIVRSTTEGTVPATTSSSGATRL